MSSSKRVRFSVGLITVAFAAGVYMTLRPAMKSDVSRSAVAPVEENRLASLADDSVEEGDVVGEVSALRREVALLRAEFAGDKVSALGRELALLRADFAGLAGDLNEMRARLDILSASTTMAEQEDNEQIAFGEMPTEEELGARQEAETERNYSQSLARMQTYEANLQAEPVGTAWSTQATDNLNEALATEELSATMVENIECRDTLCRVQVAHANEEQRRQFEGTFPLSVGEVLPRAVMHTEKHEDGSSTSTVYLARDGYRFPEVETSYEW